MDKKLFTESEKNNIKMAFSMLAVSCHKMAFEKGFWSSYDSAIRMAQMYEPLDTRGIAALASVGRLGLITTEISEAMEAARILRWSGKDSVTEELADAIIRIFDICGKFGLNIGETLLEKMEYNSDRPRLHGKQA